MEHKSTREKMANMSKKEKASYIWEYYRYHIIGTIVAIIFVTSFVSGILKQKESILGVTLVGKTIDTAKFEELKNKTNAEIIKDDPKNKKTVSYEYMTITDNAMDEYSRASRDKLTVTIAANELDVVILDKATYDSYVKQGMFLRLDTLAQYSNSLLKNYPPVKGKIEAEGSDNSEGVYGINVENLPILNSLKFDSKDKVLCIITNTKRLDKSIEYINWLLSQTSI
jgi:hypothetical protein